MPGTIWYVQGEVMYIYRVEISKVLEDITHSFMLITFRQSFYVTLVDSMTEVQVILAVTMPLQLLC